MQMYSGGSTAKCHSVRGSRGSRFGSWHSFSDGTRPVFCCSCDNGQIPHSVVIVPLYFFHPGHHRYAFGLSAVLSAVCWKLLSQKLFVGTRASNYLNWWSDCDRCAIGFSCVRSNPDRFNERMWRVFQLLFFAAVQKEKDLKGFERLTSVRDLY